MAVCCRSSRLLCPTGATAMLGAAPPFGEWAGRGVTLKLLSLRQELEWGMGSGIIVRPVRSAS